MGDWMVHVPHTAMRSHTPPFLPPLTLPALYVEAAARWWRAVRAANGRVRTKWNWYVCKSLVSLCMRDRNVVCRVRAKRAPSRIGSYISRLCPARATLFARKQANYRGRNEFTHSASAIAGEKWIFKRCRLPKLNAGESKAVFLFSFFCRLLVWDNFRRLRGMNC